MSPAPPASDRRRGARAAPSQTSTGTDNLDLFITNYVAFKAADNPYCGNARLKTRLYCHPITFQPLSNTVYRNDGKGIFSDMTASSGVGAHSGNGLGVVVADLDDDQWPEVFVANDSTPNFLFDRTGPWRFGEIALRSGVALATDGRARAGMGVDAGDYDGDGLFDLVVTNLNLEMHSLFRSLGRGLFTYATPESGIGPARCPFVGFGVVFLDFDNDMQLDLRSPTATSWITLRSFGPERPTHNANCCFETWRRDVLRM